MPKVSKKRRFYETPFWRCKQEVQEDVVESPQPVPETNKPESDPGVSDSSQSDAECLKETASERKLGTVTPTHTEEHYEDRTSISYHLVELSGLMTTFQELHKCNGGKIVYNDEQAKEYGNGSLIHIQCTKCKKKVYLQTSANCDGNWKAQNALIHTSFILLVKWVLDMKLLL